MPVCFPATRLPQRRPVPPAYRSEETAQSEIRSDSRTWAGGARRNLRSHGHLPRGLHPPCYHNRNNNSISNTNNNISTIKR